MANKTNIPQLKIEPDKEIESWNKFRKRFEIAAISVRFSAKMTETDYGRKKREASKRESGIVKQPW